MSEVDAIVLDLDGGEALADLIRSMERQTLPFGRIILWDNGSRVPLAQRLPATSLPVELHRSDTNLGFAGGVNAAMRLSKAPLVAWINNDVRLEPQWLETMAEAMRDGRVGAVQSIIASEDGRIDGAGITIAGGTFRQRGHSLAIGTLLADPVWGVSATAALFRRAALDSASRGEEFLDERFFAYYEDVELAARLDAAGWRPRVVEQPLAFHRGSMSESRIDALRLRTRNRYFVRRLHPEVGRFGALLQEDAREIFRLAVKGRIGRIARIKLAVFEGLLRRL